MILSSFLQQIKISNEPKYNYFQHQHFHIFGEYTCLTQYNDVLQCRLKCLNAFYQMHTVYIFRYTLYIFSDTLCIYFQIQIYFLYIFRYRYISHTDILLDTPYIYFQIHPVYIFRYTLYIFSDTPCIYIQIHPVYIFR